MKKFGIILGGTLGLCWLIGTGCMGSGQAVSPTDDRAVAEALAQFFDEIPDDYYSIREIPELKRMVAEEDALLIDIRQPTEYASGHIMNAINIPLNSLGNDLDKIPQDRPVIIYCSSGYRSGMGMMKLRLLGYSNVITFPPSIQGWKAAGEPLEQ